jgi:Holliday junction resolvase RusA-like endonuclease
MILVRLPWPPSCNHMYRRAEGGQVRLTKYAATYRAVVRSILALHGARPIAGPVALTIDLYPPREKRTMDIDNALKALLDALEGRCFKNDSAVCRLLVTRRERRAGGEVVVQVERWEG